MRKTPKPETAPPADAHLWRKVAESARPLRHKRARAGESPRASNDASLSGRAHVAPEISSARATQKPASPSRPAPVAAKPPAKTAATPLPTPHPGVMPAGMRSHDAPGVDRATAMRLRRGEMAIDATLDLHGMTQKEAHAALLGHIARAHTLGQRCLLVVTGKGGKQDGSGRETGVLRANVPRWLNEPPARAHVLAFAAARPRHGGEGALYVLIRRTRDARANPRAHQIKGSRT
jgi:DNA-nicking Smr family endonuclease